MKHLKALIKIDIVLPDCNEDLDNVIVANELNEMIKYGLTYEHRIAVDLNWQVEVLDKDDWGPIACR